MPQTYRMNRKTGKVKKNGYQKRRANNLATYRRKKMKFQNKRRPFVEIKSRSHKELWETLGGSDTYYPTVDGVSNPTSFVTLTSGVNNSPVTSSMLPVWSYYNPVQGITEKDMLGTTLTGKYLSAKLTFRFPETPQVKNPRYYIIHGWVTTPTNLNEFTTPAKAAFTRNNLLSHIFNHLKRDFDQVGDLEFLQFKEKVNKQYRILGYKRINPDQRRQQFNPNQIFNPNAGSSGENQIAGTIPSDINLNLKWNLNNRKIKYSKGLNQDTVITDGIPFFYHNTGWMPFILYYCPDSGDIPNGVTNSPQLAYNDKFWFSDS